MTADFELVPLDCPSCGSYVEAEGHDVVFYCVSCRNGYGFDRDERKLTPLEVSFVAAANVAAEKYLPFWLLPATVEMRQRTGSRDAIRGFVGLMSSFLGSEKEPARKTGKGVFAVPAFQAGLDATTELVRRYTQALPSLGEKLGERLLGGCCGAEDARKLAHYALIATEIDRPDTLRQLDYRMEFGPARLLGVPFQRDGDGWRDSLYRIRI